MTKRKKTKTGKYHKWISREGLIKLEGWARDGLTDEQIAYNIGINRATLYTWKNKYSNIDNALKRGKEVVDRQVENALFTRALGYTYDEIKTEDIVIGGELVKGGKVTTTRKEVIPDTTAMIFWLKNRKPTEWRDKKDLSVTTDKKLEDFFSD